MGRPLSVRTLRRWYRASVGFALFTAVGFGVVCIDGPADTMAIISLGCAFAAAVLNALNFRTVLHRRLAEEERE